MFPYLSSELTQNYCTAPEPKGQRSIFILVDPRHVESTAIVRNSDQLVIKDYAGNFVAVREGSVISGREHIEHATLFRLEIYAAVPLPGEPVGSEEVTTSSQVVFEEVQDREMHPHFLAVEPSPNGRWHVHCESITIGDMETFEIVDPRNYLDVLPVWNNDVIYLRSVCTGAYLAIDPKSGWLFADAKKPDPAFCSFSIAKDLALIGTHKKKSVFLEFFLVQKLLNFSSFRSFSQEKEEETKGYLQSLFIPPFLCGTQVGCGH